jgi:hypothetical protein
MTDGLFNTSYKFADISPKDNQIIDSNADFASLCTAMKLKGVIVFSIGFGLWSTAEPDRTKAKASLSDCATEPANFFDAETDVQLYDAFTTIAAQLLALRLSS